MNNNNLKNPCCICREKEGTCEDRESGGFACGECFTSIIHIDYELTHLVKYGYVTKLAENPKDLSEVAIIEEENEEFLSEEKNNYQKELVITSKDWELIWEFKDLVSEAEEVSKNPEFYLYFDTE